MAAEQHGADALKGYAKEFTQKFSQIEQELGKVIVGNSELVRLTLCAIFAGGHVLLEGVPGLGKTLMVRSISAVMGLSFNRIQFTSDLMPSDVTGTQVLTEDAAGKRSFVFRPGPLFSHIVLADEINRTGPKTQSALLEAMEEKQVTVLGTTHPLPDPFFVLATQNPIELDGTYPLPEAQLDRFLLKLLLTPPSPAELKEILRRTTGTTTGVISPAFQSDRVIGAMKDIRRLVRHVVIAPPLEDVLVGILYSLSPSYERAPEIVSRYVRFGPGPRGAQAVLLLAKVMALLDGRLHIAFEDIRDALLPALRHRVLLNYQAEADNVSSDDIINEVKNLK